MVAVIWTIGLVMLLGTVLMVGARYRTRGGTSIGNSERVAVAADSAVNMAIMLLLAPSSRADGFPLVCKMPGGELVTVTVNAEAGKLDLNAGSARSLTALFVGLAGSQAIGEHIAAGIVKARDPRLADTTTTSAGVQIGFKSILELDRIPGLTQGVLRAALPMVTVRSGRAEPDPASAPEALRELLGVPAAAPLLDRIDGDVTIRADVSAGRNSRFVRDALVSLRPDADRLYAIREWRRADLDFLQTPDVASDPWCLDALQASR